MHPQSVRKPSFCLPWSGHIISQIFTWNATSWSRTDRQRMSKCRKKEYSTVPQCPVWVYPSTTSLYVYAPGFFNQNSRVSKTKSSQNNQINLQCTFKTHPGYAEDVADSCGGTLVSDIFLKRVDFQLKIMSKMVRHWILLRLHHTLNCGYFWPGLPPWGHTLREPGSNFIELLSAQICLAWSFFLDKNRITNQISICCRLLVTGIQLLFA